MIARMKKVLLVLLEREKTAGLRALRRLGVVHLEPVAGQGRDHETLARRLAAVDRALAALASVKETKERRPSTDESAAAGFAAADEVNALAEERRALQEELTALGKELDRVAGLGDFEPRDIGHLAEAGLRLRLYECPARVLESLPEQVTYLRLASPKGSARVALLSEPSQPLPPELAQIDLPAQSPARMRELIAAGHARLEAIAARTTELGALRPALHAAREQVRQDLGFEAVRSGMAEQGQLASLSGWVPAGNLPALRAEAAARAWGLCADDPSAEELPPTKVESNAVVRIIAPVFKFLGTVPGYREYDISSVFLVFFSLYFAMIFGDGGYGLILLAAGIVAALKARGGGKPVSDAVRLLLVLASTTVAWGVATGSFFALPFERLPGFLRAAALPAISNDNPESGTNIKIFCFIVGAVQISLAHIRNIVRDFPRPQFLAQLGSLAMVIGMFVAVLNLVVDSNRFPLSSWVVITIGAGFILVFIFGSWEGTLLKSLLAGLKGIIPTFLGTVSVFADVVSYIRLWAVGLAGVAISQTVNGMAAGMFGEPAGRIVAFAIGAVMGVVLIAVGHALNVVMTVLSVIVHGIRLNMLEFSMHLGMEWSGYTYDPFRETVRAETTNQKEST